MNPGFRNSPLARAKRVLVLHDLHPDADNAAWRGGMLARAHGGWLRVLNLGRFGDPQAAQTRLAPLVWRLQEHLQLAVLAQALRGSFARELASAAEDADLIVIRAPSVLEAVMGLHPLRVLRLAGRPTLVVRTSATMPYRRVLVGAPPGGGVGHGLVGAAAMTDGKEVPAVAPSPSADALLEREQALFPDLVIVPCSPGKTLARRFLAHTRADTLLLPAADAGARSGAMRPDAGILCEPRLAAQGAVR